MLPIDDVSETHLIPQPHNPAWRSDGDETARDESLNTGEFGGLGKRHLILLLRRTNTADDNIDSRERLEELFFGSLQITSADFDSPLLQFRNGRLPGGQGANKSSNILLS